MLLFHSMFISEDMAIFLFQCSKGPQLPIIWPNEKVKDQVPPRFELGSLDYVQNGAKGIARLGEKRKNEEGGGEKREKEKEKKGGKCTLIHFLSILLSSQHCLHTLLHLLQGLSSL